MRRILIVDDNDPAYEDELKEDIRSTEGVYPYVNHVNPTDYLSSGLSQEESNKLFFNKIKEIANDFWDVVAIDLNLGDFGFGDYGNLLVCLDVAEIIREENSCASILLYSGTLAKYIQDILKGGASDTQLRRIFHSGVANFYQRNRIAREVASAIDNPSWLLRIDRLLTENENILISPEEAEYAGLSFSDVARLVRLQNSEGKKITQLALEYGIASFADLNS